MKIVGVLIAVVGFFVVAGTAGSDDFYHECLAAADCVAGEPMSLFQVIVQSLMGLLLMLVGAAIAWAYGDQ
jgi:hypothetical protein